MLLALEVGTGTVQPHDLLLLAQLLFVAAYTYTYTHKYVRPHNVGGL